MKKYIRNVTNANNNAKTYKGEWYSINSVFGNDWASFYCLLGGRETGKSYSAMQWGIHRKLKKGSKMKFYWFRLTEAAAENLLKGGADKFIDPDIQREHNIKTFTKGSDIYTYEPIWVEKPDGTHKEEKTKIKPFATVLACSTFYNTKGVGYFDAGYKGEYYIVLDEMNREASEKNSFDIVYGFANLLENIVRSTKIKIKVIMIGNTLEETSDILSAFNFIPQEFGRYKLKAKRCVIDYIMPNERYLERRKDALANILAGSSSTFTNEAEVMLDPSLLVSKRECITPRKVIMFNKKPDSWYTLWNNNIIKPYNKEDKPALPMRRYLNAVYDREDVIAIQEGFDYQYFKFTNIATYKRFQKELKLLKKN